MNHPSEQDLVLYFYGDAPDAGALKTHLAECGTCAAEFTQLRATLTSIDYPVPERAADYEAQLWSTLRPRLNEAANEPPKRSWWATVFQPRRWAMAGALAVIVIGAFLAGRYWPEKTSLPPMANTGAPSTGGSDRVLMVAVGDHLDRTEMILVELVNARPESKVDISAERDLAQTLVKDNRLYRQTAERSKDPEIAGVLDQVERTLVDIAHQPDSISGKQLEELQKQIESQGILFKVRVIESKAKARGQAKTTTSTSEPQSSKL